MPEPVLARGTGRLVFESMLTSLKVARYAVAR